MVHWAGFTKGYQGKRIDNTSLRDEPYEFVLGGGQAIRAFEEAVSGMKVGGIRRIEVPGSSSELGYPRCGRDRGEGLVHPMHFVGWTPGVQCGILECFIMPLVAVPPAA